MQKGNGVATTETWRQAARAERESRAEQLTLPSGATILAARPEPLEWVMSGRIPQGLLAIALEDRELPLGGGDRELTRDEIVDLAAFAARLVEASVVDPAIGEGPDEIALEDIPVRDRAFIFEWACRVLSGDETGDSPAGAANTVAHSTKEEPSSASLERFRQK